MGGAGSQVHPCRDVNVDMYAQQMFVFIFSCVDIKRNTGPGADDHWRINSYDLGLLTRSVSSTLNNIHRISFDGLGKAVKDARRYEPNRRDLSQSEQALRCQRR